MRHFYSLLFFLSTPLVLLRLYLRGIKAPAYRRRWLERLGIYQEQQAHRQHCIWFHAVSVGEAEAVFPLIKLFQRRNPDIPLLVTTTTPTGSARVRAVLAETVEHVYLPYDLPFVVSKFLRYFKPQLGVIMETEIWPNLYHSCGLSHVPLFVINARLSERSTKGYRKIPSLVQPTLANIRLIATQSSQDSERFNLIGANPEKIKTVGNVKFDLSIADEIRAQGHQLKQQILADRLVWVIASTHQGEEDIFLQLYRKLKQQFPELLLLLVPRHPERFEEVRHQCEQQQLHVLTRTSGKACDHQTDVFLGDTMGELKLFYAAADLAFVGGSMVSVGGHNVLEPAALDIPVLFGPNMANFKAIANGLLNVEGAKQCQDADAIEQVVKQLLQDTAYRQELITNAKSFIQQNQGATEALYRLLQDALK